MGHVEAKIFVAALSFLVNVVLVTLVWPFKVHFNNWLQVAMGLAAAVQLVIFLDADGISSSRAEQSRADQLRNILTIAIVVVFVGVILYRIWRSYVAYKTKTSRGLFAGCLTPDHGDDSEEVENNSGAALHTPHELSGVSEVSSLVLVSPGAHTLGDSASTTNDLSSTWSLSTSSESLSSSSSTAASSSSSSSSTPASLGSDERVFKPLKEIADLDSASDETRDNVRNRYGDKVHVVGVNTSALSDLTLTSSTNLSSDEMSSSSALSLSSSSSSSLSSSSSSSSQTTSSTSMTSYP